MPKETKHTAGSTARVGVRSAALVAVALAGSIGLAAIAASPAAAVHKVQGHKKGPGTSTAAQLAKDEKALSALEAAAPSGVKIAEKGSSLFYPLWLEWQGGNPPDPLNPAAGGSGQGVAGAIAGTVQIGASDAFLPKTQLAGPPVMLDIPVVVSAQDLVYNLSGVPASTHIKLTATIVNDIYDGAITHWNNKLIAKANPGLTLPTTTIVPIRRSDSSGDTFLFTSYIYYGDKSSWNHPSPYDGPNLFYASWPSVSGELAENGNQGIVNTLKTTPGGIGYVGVSYFAQTNAAGLGFAALQNGKGNFVTPSNGTIAAEVGSYQRLPANGAISLIYSKSAPKGYPITNFEYAIVQQNQASSTTAAAIKAVLAWGMDPRDGAASSFLSPVNFRPLAVNALTLAIKLVQSIS
jgi:phosphate transport system substrate-binding protein